MRPFEYAAAADERQALAAHGAGATYLAGGTGLVDRMELDARVVVRAGADVRTLSLEDLYPLPGETPARETALAPGELVVGLDVPRSRAAARSCYLKVRDRASFEFALVSVAAALEVDASGAVADARLALGGVGTRPWRVREAERRLVGSPPDREAFTAAAERAVEGAMTTTETAFKVELTRRAVVRALQMAV